MKRNKPDDLAEAVEWNEKNARLLREGLSPIKNFYLQDYHV
jgi:hypothetical protein